MQAQISKGHQTLGLQDLSTCCTSISLPPTRRIVLLGKTGAGKSSVANTLFGETTFKMGHSPDSETSICISKSKLINRRSITLVDTPGFFDTSRSEEDMKPNILQCIVECAPGPHAFIVVLKVEKFTDHEKSVIENMFQHFSEEVLRYAVILFTHGDQLLEEMKIEEFVSQSKCLADLVQKCGGRCHVIDNKYWNNEAKNEYRSNKFQVEQLLKTIDDIVMENKGGYYTNDLLQLLKTIEKMVVEKNGGYYTNKMLEHVETAIREQEEHIRQSMPDKTPEEIRKQAKTNVINRFLIQMAGIGTGALLGVFFGVVTLAEFAIKAVTNPQLVNVATKLSRFVPAAQQQNALVAAGAVGLVGAATAGGIMGGVIGNDAAKDSESLSEAVRLSNDNAETSKMLSKEETLSAGLCRDF
uniref:AIG1-type G domain-containing protein n=1 Tax=Neolamprologus brichardi TaxID=32507 RepID=A0A3Q4GEM4_NEOBR